MNVLNQPTLCLNANWQPLPPKSVKEAIVAMMGGANGNCPPAYGIDQEFAVDANGNVDWSNMLYANPVKWEDWVKLPIREDQDDVIHTATMKIRVPRVIIQPNFSKMPTVTPRPTKEAVMRRDGGICQYTGAKLTRGQGNIDHVIPRDKGGKNTFENMVWCEKGLNSFKANRTPKEIGLKLIRKPKAPPSIPVSATITEAKHPSWAHFLLHVKKAQ